MILLWDSFRACISVSVDQEMAMRDMEDASSSRTASAIIDAEETEHRCVEDTGHSQSS